MPPSDPAKTLRPWLWHNNACSSLPVTEACSCGMDAAVASLTRPTLTEEERADVEAEREDRCHCHESYTSRNLIAPDCRHEDIDVLLAVIDRLTEGGG